MGVIARCRKEKINLSIRDVLQSGSITQLALRVGAIDNAPQQEEKVEEPFDLSPIQQMYFQSATSHQGQARFNQSFSLRVTRKTQAHDIKRVIESIVNQHSMLRARFRKNNFGIWQQHISKVGVSSFKQLFRTWGRLLQSQDITSSYRYRVYQVDAVGEISPFIAGTQASLNLQHGPLFAVDLFDVRGDDQMVFLTAHHLCVDMVSWRIILQDLQEFLETGSLTAEKPVAFQTWCAIQVEQSRQQTSKDLLPFDVMPTDLAYWAMEGRRNTYSDVECETFAVDEALTTLALGDCHKTLQTEPLDLFLSTIAHSFKRIFADRANPTLYNESHGRENPTVDLSRTVGWFTTICPIHFSFDFGKFALSS